MEPSVRIVQCPVCFEFGSISIDTVLCHLVDEHECNSCGLFHNKPNSEKFCRKQKRKRNQHFCWKVNCARTFTDLNGLIAHLTLRHRCDKCNTITCECMDEDEFTVPQTGSGNDSQTSLHTPQPEGIEVNEVDESNRSPSPQPGPSKRSRIETENADDPQPGTSQGQENPRTPTLKPVDPSEKEAYLRIRAKICPHCQMTFDSKEECHHHCVHAHPETCQHLQNVEVEDPLTIHLTRTAFEDAYTTYELPLDHVEVGDMNALFMAIKRQYKKIIKTMIKKQRNFKVQFHTKCQFYREDNGLISTSIFPMVSFNFVVENQHSANFAFNSARSHFNVRIENYLNNGSNWVFQRVNEFRIQFSEYKALIGGGKNHPLPDILCEKRYNFINVPGDDGLCFLRCLTLALYKNDIPKGDPHRWRTFHNQKFYNDRMQKTREELNLEGINYPFDIKQAAKFEKQNPDYGLSIFLFDEHPERVDPILPDADLIPDCELQEEILKHDSDRSQTSESFQKRMSIYEEIRRSIYPIKICKEEKKNIIDLLLVQNGDVGHYVYIDNLLGLLRHPTRANQTIICRYCLQTFHKMADTHEKYCSALGRMRTDFPKEQFLKWKNYKNTIPLLFLGAMDFEARLPHVNVLKGNMRKIRHHKAASYGWAVIDNDGKLVSHNKYVARANAEDVAEMLLLELLKKADNVADQVHTWNIFANQHAKAFNSKARPIEDDEICKFCDEPIFTEDNDKYVRHHDHFPPFKFQFYAHPECNAKAQTKAKLVVLAHNLRGYDSHFIIKACSKKSIKHKVEVIGSSSEKFFAIFIGNLILIDSMNFMNTGLDSVVKTMNKTTDFPISRQYFSEQYPDEEKLDLILSKGIYCYDYVDDVSKYDETSLPPPKAFYNTLTKKDIDPKDYEHAQKVWKELDVKDLRHYTEIYNMSDVLLTLDCFQKFRNVFRKCFGLDAAHYFSLPHLSWDCALKSSKAELEYIKDETMMCWLESGTRGGLASGLEFRHAKANNHFLPDYDSSKPSSYIMVHDINNLYGSAMCSYLPTKDFKWLSENAVTEIRKNATGYINEIDDEAEQGCFLEVDLEFPKEIHDDLKGLTPVPYKRVINHHELSPDIQELAEKLGMKDSSTKSPRLVADLHPKKNYVVHYRVLKLYCSLGIVITNVHRGITFKQEPILRDYILELAKKRSETSDKFEQDQWKLAANACFGKTIESVRNRSRFVIVKDRETALKYNRKPTVAEVILLDSDTEGEDIAIIRLKKLHVVLDKPVYLGITVLDESKKILYEWFYNYAKVKWGDGIRTLATDTDSVISLIETENVYQDMYEDKEKFDMSDYDQNHEIWKKYYCGDNKKRLKVMKDENANQVVSSFIFLRPKMYVYDRVSLDGTVTEVKKAKGLNKQSVKSSTSRHDYEEALENPIQKTVECVSIRSEKHEVFTMILQKKGLCSFDQKRYILPDYVSTLPHGHYLIKHEHNGIVEDEVTYDQDQDEIHQEEEIMM